jgi:DHA2 family multidrug resistance protein
VVDLRALKSRNFALGCFFSFVTGIGIFATIYLTPLFLAGCAASARCRSAGGLLDRLFQICAIPVYTMLARRSICAG